VKLLVFNASNVAEIDAAFVALTQQRAGGLVINGDAYFIAQRDRVIALAARHTMPTIYAYREFAAAGGLMSYGPSLPDGYRRSGVYVGRILKGEKPADLPVERSIRIELVINSKTAKTLGIEVPLSLLVRADDTIE
jgi:putative ABC transport system substrate-binding protein